MGTPRPEFASDYTAPEGQLGQQAERLRAQRDHAIRTTASTIVAWPTLVEDIAGELRAKLEIGQQRRVIRR